MDGVETEQRQPNLMASGGRVAAQKGGMEVEREAVETGEDAASPVSTQAEPEAVAARLDDAEMRKQEQGMGEGQREEEEGREEVEEEQIDPKELAAELKEQGNTKYKEKDYYGALDCYNKAIKADPENAAYYNNRAQAEMTLDLTQKSILSLEKCLELEPKNVKAMIRLGKNYIKLGMADKAEEVAKSALEQDPTNSAAVNTRNEANYLKQRIQCAKEALNKGDFRQALNFAQAAVRQAPESRELGLIRTQGFVAAGDFDQAYSLTTKLMRDNQNDPKLLTIRAKCLYLQENFANAERHLQQALQLDPDDREAQVLIKKIRKLQRMKDAGNKHFKAGRNEKAVEEYTKCLEVDPENKSFNAKLHCNRAAALQKIGKHEAALKDSQKAIELNPDYGKAYIRKAWTLRAMGGKENLEMAVHAYEEAERVVGRTQDLRNNIRETKLELKKAKRKDYYKILGLPKGEASNEAEIKKAYKKSALRLHPDRHASKSEEDQAKAEADFKEVGEAYAVLSDPEKRRKYDEGQTLEEIEQGHPGMAHDPNEIFQMFFGGGMGGGGFHRGGGGFHFG